MEPMGAVTRLAGFLRAGHPDGLPSTGYVPLFALMQRRPFEEDVAVPARHGRH
jgi:hypothetical protein